MVTDELADFGTSMEREALLLNCPTQKEQPSTSISHSDRRSFEDDSALALQVERIVICLQPGKFFVQKL